MNKISSFKCQAQNRSGQVLLIAVMLLATVITVVMTIAFNATTETQVARLEADSQKALAAAEAGIDAIIKQSANNSTVDIGALGQFGEQNISGNAQIVGVTQSFFVTPLLQKDEQYTFYLSDYPGYGNPWNGSFDISLVSESGQCPSIEVTIISNPAIKTQTRYAYNTCASTISGATPASQPGSPIVIDGVSFQWKTPAPISIADGQIAFIKVLSGRTKLGFQSTDVAVSLPSQGRTVRSEARTESGVVKKVQLFQSYPQIPSNFFMTSF
jgi:hypothetical protein